MGWLTSLLLAPIVAPIKGMVFVAEQIAKQVDTELYDEDLVQQQLMELQLRFDLGEVAPGDYEQQEAALLARLNEIAMRQEEM